MARGPSSNLSVAYDTKPFDYPQSNSTNQQSITIDFDDLPNKLPYDFYGKFNSIFTIANSVMKPYPTISNVHIKNGITFCRTENFVPTVIGNTASDMNVLFTSDEVKTDVQYAIAIKRIKFDDEEKISTNDGKSIKIIHCIWERHYSPIYNGTIDYPNKLTFKDHYAYHTITEKRS